MMMNFSLFVAAAFILSTGTHAQEPCSVCPDGIYVDADTPTENGYVCGTIQSDAADYDADDRICQRIKGFEETCCSGVTEPITEDDLDTTEEAVAVATEFPLTTDVPEIVEAQEQEETGVCSVCPQGINVDPDTATEGNNVCGTIQTDAARFDADDNICSRIKAFEATCCPTAVTTVASIDETDAATETTLTNSTVAGAEAEVADNEEVAYVDVNATIASDETMLTTAVPGSCIVCPGGITAPGTIQTGAGKTCGDLLSDAALQVDGDGVCEFIQQSEDICCPEGGFAPCSFCTSGITASGATLLIGDITCDDMIADATQIQDSSDICNQVKGFEGTCCPTIVESTTAATTTTAATNTPSTETNSTVEAVSVTSTIASFDFDVEITKSPTIAPSTQGNDELSLIDDEELTSTTISGFNAVYDTSEGFSSVTKSMNSCVFIGIVIAYAFSM